MPTLVRHLALVGIALALSSCANAAKLAKQSQESLAKGDLRKAYDRGLRAVEKDPLNQSARDAYHAASTRVAADYRARVVAAAAGDTIAAANLALEYREFRLEVAHHETQLDAAPDYDRAERAILTGAARAYYARGQSAMDAHRPKIAVDEFQAVRRYDDNYRDVASQLAEARRQATARVALLPFTDRIGVPGLSQDIADTVQRQVSRRANDEFRFTEIVSAGELERNMTVAESRSTRLEDAIEAGRRVGATMIVVGRFRSLRSNASQRTTRFPLYHRVERKDSTGVVTSHWETLTLPVVTRQRDVSVLFEVDVVEVATGAVLAHREQTPQAIARVAWTDFTAEEHYDRYNLLPPDLRAADPKRAKAADTDWRATMGSWDLKDFMRRSRDQRTRARYSSRYRGEFYENTRETPAWLAELPSENEMVFVALHEVWREVLAALKDLDSKT
jgi:hypothetical protein